MTNSLLAIIAAISAPVFGFAGIVYANWLNRKKVKVEQQKLEAETENITIDSRVKMVTSFADAANTMAGAHKKTEEGWSNLVEGMAIQIDRLREKEAIYEVKLDQYEKEIESLKNLINEERIECDMKIQKIKEEAETLRLRDKQDFISEIRKLGTK